MSNDLFARARAAVAATPMPVDTTASSTLVARAKAAVAATPDTPVFVARRPPPPPPPPGRLVVSIDATGSRCIGWTAALGLQDRILKSMPDRFEIALAVYHNDLDTFTPFLSNRRRLRAIAARIDCTGGYERLPDVLARVAKIDGVAATINCTDASASCGPEALDHIEMLRAHGTRVFILIDPSDGMPRGFIPPIYAEVTARTGGVVLPFEAASVPKLLRYLNGSTIGKLHHG